MTALDYSSVTEKAGDWVTSEAVSMLYTRYRYASEFCRNKRLLEVACGQGVGLRYLAQYAGDTIGGDITAELLGWARRRSGEPVPLLCLDVENIPLSAASRDVIVCYEAIYYFEHPIRFLQECRRVLSPEGVLLLCTVNPEWPDFNPSPHSHRYYSAQQLAALLQAVGFQAEVFGAFPVAGASLRGRGLSWIKRAAVRLRLMPSTMAGKRFLKRLFLGRLSPFPDRLNDGTVAYCPPLPLPLDRMNPNYKILFVLGRRA